jgi:hypothetical protein
MVKGLAFGGEVDEPARNAIGQNFTSLVRSNPPRAAGALTQNPAIFGSQAQIFNPTELHSMLGDVGFSRNEQNPPMPAPADKKDDGSQQPTPPPVNLLGGLGYAEGGRVTKKTQPPKQPQPQKKQEPDPDFDYMGQSEFPPSRQRVEGIEGELVFPQFSYNPPGDLPVESRRPPLQFAVTPPPPIPPPAEGTVQLPPPPRSSPPEEGVYSLGGLVQAPGYYAAGGLGLSAMRSHGTQAHYSGSNVKPAIKPPGVHLVNSNVPGRNDRIPMQARTGSFVLPADVVSGLGQGNTMAGAKMWGDAISSSVGPMGIQNVIRRRTVKGPPMPRTGSLGKTRGFADGGAMDGEELTPIVVAGGECLVDPEFVCELGGGDPELGKKHLSNSVMTVRNHVIKHLKGLPRPVK